MTILPLPTHSDRQPVVCIVGLSSAGKTTVTVGLVDALTARDFRAGTIKHEGHGFEMDRTGKDSWRHRQAGAKTTVITSPDRIGMIMDADHDHQPDELLPLFKRIDILLPRGSSVLDFPRSKFSVRRTVSHPPAGTPPAWPPWSAMSTWIGAFPGSCPGTAMRWPDS